MGIYGESMNLVTEGKIIDKFKKTFKKITKEYKKLDKKHQNDSIYHRAAKEVFNMKYTGHFEFVQNYFMYESDKIFCKLTPESAEKYLEDIEKIFTFSDFEDIKTMFLKKYNYIKYSYTDKNETDAINFYNKLVDKYMNTVNNNIEVVQKYETENYTNKGRSFGPSDKYFVAIDTQIKLYRLCKLLLEQFKQDIDKNFKKYVEENETKEERAKRYMAGIEL